MSTTLIDFPSKTRGTYRIKTDDKNSEAEKLEFAKKLIDDLAKSANVTILLDCKISGGGWLLLWWPASEPRHASSDQIIN